MQIGLYIVANMDYLTFMANTNTIKAACTLDTRFVGTVVLSKAGSAKTYEVFVSHGIVRSILRFDTPAQTLGTVCAPHTLPNLVARAKVSYEWNSARFDRNAVKAANARWAVKA